MVKPVESPARFAARWCLTGAGVENVWHYTREVLACPAGRVLLRGPNGTGKTTLLEGLCPYLLDLQAGKLGSGRNRATSLESLMRAGAQGRRRTGYLWLSFTAPAGGVPEEAGREVYYGVRLEYPRGCSPAVEVVPWWSPHLPGGGTDLSALAREEFKDHLAAVGGAVFKEPGDYVARLAETVFGCGPEVLRRLARRIRRG